MEFLKVGNVRGMEGNNWTKSMGKRTEPSVHDP